MASNQTATTLLGVGKRHFYVYDPETFAILLQPGQRLIKVQAERLQSLGLYDDMVESISY